MSAIVPLILVAFPAALVGLRFSFRGRHSSSRRGLAIAGLVLSLTALAPFLVLMVALCATVSYCSTHLCL